MIGFGAFADLGTITRNMRLEAYMSYWSKSEEAFELSANANDLTLGARSKYMFRVPSPRLLPFVGGGIGVHFIEQSVSDQNDGIRVIPGYEDSATKVGLDL
ncbi:MAG: hypothetical protein GWN29_07580, partial [Gammaproteobacteria bacterium]|nr:hypothetical protein [Gammaproteobacteria bacterium]